MMEVAALPQNVQTICREFVRGLKAILDDNLHGVYMYGAAMFEDAGQIQDIDCHVILERPPGDRERERLFALHRALGERFPPLGGEVDAYYVLRRDAMGHTPPQNHLRTEMHDESWALHSAHIRAGRYLALHGPAPSALFPAPTWPEITAALDHELRFVQAHPDHPAYGVLNLCRILYSVQTRDVAVSKRFSGKWACRAFPHWAPLINVAMRVYDGEAASEDHQRLSGEMGPFLEFAYQRIRETWHRPG